MIGCLIELNIFRYALLNHAHFTDCASLHDVFLTNLNSKSLNCSLETKTHTSVVSGHISTLHGLSFLFLY